MVYSDFFSIVILDNFLGVYRSYLDNVIFIKFWFSDFSDIVFFNLFLMLDVFRFIVDVCFVLS